MVRQPLKDALPDEPGAAVWIMRKAVLHHEWRASFSPARSASTDNEPVRTVRRMVAALGGVALVLAVVLDLTGDNPRHVWWVLLGPLPYYLPSGCGCCAGR